VLPTGRNFGRKTQKVARKKSQQPDKSAAKFSTNLAKSGRKEAKLFLSLFLVQKARFLQNHTVQSTYLLNFFLNFVWQASAYKGKSCEWPEFFSSGQIFQIFWQITFARSWQHWLKILNQVL
jgi:hypothetical protein